MIKERFDAELKDLLLRYQWWNLEPEKLVEILPVDVYKRQAL